jgi:hypothetical protein
MSEPTDPEGQGGIAPGEFFRLTLAAAGDWTRFADPKVFGVFVFLGLGMSDLVDHAGALVAADAPWTATAAFFVACALAVLTVACASVALFPRVKREGGAERSLFFFGDIAALSPDAFEREVRARSGADLERELARQAWELARIASLKTQWARRSYGAAVAFLCFWAIARIALSTA